MILTIPFGALLTQWFIGNTFFANFSIHNPFLKIKLSGGKNMSISGKKNQDGLSTHTTITGKAGITEYLVLENRNCFYIQHALILLVGGQYRLIVYQSEKVLIDKIYNTRRGPIIAFSKLYKKRAFDESIKPSWSEEIPGDLRTLDPPLPLEILEGSQ